MIAKRGKMKIDFIEEKVKECGENKDRHQYLLKDLKANFFSVDIIDEELYIFWNENPDMLNNVDNENNWGEFGVATFSHGYLGNRDSIKVEFFWHGSGPIAVLRELRHSYIGDNGYIFYIKRSRFESSFEYLSKYYDLE